MKRKPKVTVWDTASADRWTEVPVPHRPAESVFRLHEKEDADARVSRAEDFLASVGSTKLDGLSLEEVQEHARLKGLSPKTIALIEELIEHV